MNSTLAGQLRGGARTERHEGETPSLSYLWKGAARHASRQVVGGPSTGSVADALQP